ncbi:hypothetical protein RRG08_051699, partial [Elysia crispata]
SREDKNSTYFLSTPHADVWPTLKGSNWVPSAVDWPNKIIEMTRRNHVELLFRANPMYHVMGGRVSLNYKADMLVEELYTRTLTTQITDAIKKYYKDLAVELGADPQTAATDAAEVLALEREIAQIKASQTYHIRDYIGFQMASGHFQTRRLVQATYNSSNISIPSDQFVTLRFPPSYLTNIRNILDTKGRRAVYNMFAFEVARRMLERSTQRLNHIFLNYSVAVSPNNQYRTTRAFSYSSCRGRTNVLYRNLIGRMFVERKFPARSLSDVKTIVEKVTSTFKTMVNSSWLENPTKMEALRMFDKLHVFIGNGTELSARELKRFYGKLQITETDFMKNRWALREAVKAIYYWSNWNDGGKTRMMMSHPTNYESFYKHQDIQIIYTAGALQPPTYDLSFSRIYKYGTVGFYLAHELDHMLHKNHRNGKMYDSHGVQRNWYTESDRATVLQKSNCFKTQYNAMRHPVHQIAVDAQQFLWEGIADISGLMAASEAIKDVFNQTELDSLVPGTNFTLHKWFFLAYAQNWCSPNTINEYQGGRFTHPPKYFRINGAVMNNPNFANAFSCGADSAMNADTKCSVW